MYKMHKNITFNINKLTHTIKYIIISRVNDYTKRDEPGEEHQNMEVFL